MLDTADTVEEGVMRVPTFYAHDVDGLGPYRYVICINAVAFGAIHCAGWFFVFPSHPEELIWRISSVVIAGVPFILLLYVLFYESYLHASSRSCRKIVYDIVIINLTLTLFFSLPVYILARFFLLVEAFIELRALSPGAHTAVEWTSFLPHI